MKNKNNDWKMEHSVVGYFSSGTSLIKLMTASAILRVKNMHFKKVDQKCTMYVDRIFHPGMLLIIFINLYYR
jgi:hypothetical protein